LITDNKTKYSYCKGGAIENSEGYCMPKEIRLSGFVGDDLNAEYVKNVLAGVEGEDILVQLYTPGGFIVEGMEIYNIISRFKGNKNVVLGGLVASIGSIIAMAFDKISVTKASSFMIHNAWDIVGGDANEFRKKADKLEKLNTQIAGILSDRSGKSIDKIKELMNAETWYIGQEIVDAGFADELIEAADAGVQDIDRQSAVALAKEMYSNKVAAALKNNKHKFDADNDGIENKPHGEESMESKKEMLGKLVTMKENGELSLSEITDSFKIKLVTEEHESALKVINAFKEMKIDDPINFVKGLQKQITDGAEAVKNAALSEKFGVSEKDDKGNEKNLCLKYAIDKTADLFGTELDSKIKELESDPIMQQLRGQQADVTDPTNVIGVIEKNGKKKTEDNSESDIVVL